MATAVQEFNIRVVVVKGNMSAESFPCALMLFVGWHKGHPSHYKSVSLVSVRGLEETLSTDPASGPTSSFLHPPPGHCCRNGRCCVLPDLTQQYFSVYRLCFVDGRYLTMLTSHSWVVLFSTASSVCWVSLQFKSARVCFVTLRISTVIIRG